MAAYKEVNLLPPPDAAYIAGLIDGEGSIHLTRRHKSDQRQLAVSISNTELAILRYVHSAVGAGKITSKVAYRKHHTPSYAYSVANRQALALLGQITPYLKSYKAKRARLVLDDYVRLTPRNGKYSALLLKERATFIKAFFAITPHGKKVRMLKP